MTWFTTARPLFAIGALSAAALAAADSSWAPTPGLGPSQAPIIGAPQGTPQPAAIPYSDGYSCYFSDDGGGDIIVAGRLLHWCGPVPRPKN
jgi:hypothetical protein